MRRTLLISYVIATVFFLWGYTMVRHQVFPWRYFHAVERNLIAFIKGDPEEIAKTADKIMNDLDVRPGRHIFAYQGIPGRVYSDVPIDGLNPRRTSPTIFSSGSEMRGYRLIYGIMDYEDSLHATILMDQDHRVIHRWTVDREALQKNIDAANLLDGGNRKFRPDLRRLSLGLDILPDGSLVINGGHHGNGIHRIGFCGELMWSALGDFDHGVALGIDGQTVWAFRSERVMQLDLDTGAILREIPVAEISRANPYLSIFNFRRLIYSGKTLTDPYHGNDIEPLPPQIADAFPQFEAGDLVIHHRSVNLFFVLDPDDLRVKWWRSGFTRLGHDPDWQADGSITIYDNNMRESPRFQQNGEDFDGDLERYTRLVRIDPDSFETSVIYDGEVDDVYSIAKGTHQLLPGGNILLTSPHQGRVLEVNEAGETVFEFVNRYQEGEALILTEARWLPQDFFEIELSAASGCP